MTLPEVYDAEAELLANPPIHHLYADFLASRYGVKVRRIHREKQQGTQEELRQIAETYGGGNPNG